MVGERRDRPLGGLDWERQRPVLVELEHVSDVGDLISPHTASELEHSDWLEMGRGGLYGGLSCLPHAPLLPLNPEIICFRAGQGFSHEGKPFMDCSVLLSSFSLSE